MMNCPCTPGISNRLETTCFFVAAIVCAQPDENEAATSTSASGATAMMRPVRSASINADQSGWRTMSRRARLSNAGMSGTSSACSAPNTSRALAVVSIWVSIATETALAVAMF